MLKTAMSGLEYDKEAFIGKWIARTGRAIANGFSRFGRKKPGASVVSYKQPHHSYYNIIDITPIGEENKMNAGAYLNQARNFIGRHPLASVAGSGVLGHMIGNGGNNNQTAPNGNRNYYG